jgi:hypothetical protein
MAAFLTQGLAQMEAFLTRSLSQLVVFLAHPTPRGMSFDAVDRMSNISKQQSIRELSECSVRF